MADNATYGNVVGDNFVFACRDYVYLLNRHFPERSVLKLVGDRYKLSGDQRTILYRGISSMARSELRKSRITTNIGGSSLNIDGYNVLFTLLNYRMGKPLFISTDGILRDAGSLHGKLRDEKTFMECMNMLTDCLSRIKPVAVSVYFDSPVSHSELHAKMITENMQGKGINGTAMVIRSADWALVHSTEGIIATSDTAIIERALLPVTDLPRRILQEVYGAGFMDMEGILAD